MHGIFFKYHNLIVSMNIISLFIQGGQQPGKLVKVGEFETYLENLEKSEKSENFIC